MEGSRHALIIATETYDDQKLRRLHAPAQDAKALVRVLGDPAIGGFQIKQVIDQPVYVVTREIELFFANLRKSDDLLLIYFSCHGIKDDDGKLYFAAKDTEHQLLASTAVSARFLKDQMEECRSRSIVLLLDCCYSGSFVRGSKGDHGVHLKERFAGRRRAVLTSSNEIEYSWEGDELSGKGRPSLYTEAIVKGLETGDADLNGDGEILVIDLHDYACERVHPKQTPCIWLDVEGKLGDLCIARSRKGTAPLPPRTPTSLPQSDPAAQEETRPWSIAAKKDMSPTIPQESTLQGPEELRDGAVTSPVTWTPPKPLTKLEPAAREKIQPAPTPAKSKQALSWTLQASTILRHQEFSDNAKTLPFNWRPPKPPPKSEPKERDKSQAVATAVWILMIAAISIPILWAPVSDLVSSLSSLGSNTVPILSSNMTLGGPPATVKFTAPEQIANVTFEGKRDQQVGLKTEGDYAVFSLFYPGANEPFKSGEVINREYFSGPFTLPVDGTYSMVVTPRTGDEGELSLTLYDLSPKTAAIAPDGEPAAVDLVPGQAANLIFEGGKDQQVSLKVWGDCCAAFSLLAPGGKGTLESGQAGSVPDYFIGPIVLPVDGTYTIVVNPEGRYENRYAGSLTFALYDTPTIIDTITLDGPPVTVDFIMPGQTARVTFEGKKNQRVSLTITVTDCCIPVSLFDPGDKSRLGSVQAGISGASIPVSKSIGPVVLPVDGTYIIAVDPEGTDTGQATLTLTAK